MTLYWKSEREWRGWKYRNWYAICQGKSLKVFKIIIKFIKKQNENNQINSKNLKIDKLKMKKNGRKT